MRPFFAQASQGKGSGTQRYGGVCGDYTEVWRGMETTQRNGRVWRLHRGRTLNQQQTTVNIAL